LAVEAELSQLIHVRRLLRAGSELLRRARCKLQAHAHREHVIALEPLGKGLLGTTLRYDYEVRDEKDYFSGVPAPKIRKDMVNLAAHILKTKETKFDPRKFKDEYEQALKKLFRRKAKGRTIEERLSQNATKMSSTSWMPCGRALVSALRHQPRDGGPRQSAQAKRVVRMEKVRCALVRDGPIRLPLPPKPRPNDKAPPAEQSQRFCWCPNRFAGGFFIKKSPAEAGLRSGQQWRVGTVPPPRQPVKAAPVPVFFRL
jgi:hypothetical protein